MRDQILATLATGPKTMGELCKQFCTDRKALIPTLKELRNEGAVSTTGQRRGMRYVLPTEEK